MTPARSESLALTTNQSKAQQQPTTTTPAATRSTPAQSAITTQTSKTTATASASPSNTTKQPEYGPEPQNPDIFQVFDTIAVMTSAGIASDQQAAAYQTIKLSSDWQYEGLDYPSINLCRANPPAKMQSYGTDFRTNPVTQLKWCNGYVTARYGNWTAALSYAQKYAGQF